MQYLTSTKIDSKLTMQSRLAIFVHQKVLMALDDKDKSRRDVKSAGKCKNPQRKVLKFESRNELHFFKMTAALAT
jgi:hypothetical protein